MALLEVDRRLLQRCIEQKAHAWEDFVDRFVGLIVHVIRHSASTRSIELSHQDEEDLAAECFLTFVKDDFAVLRRFRGQSSLATYLTVVARRVVVRELLRRHVGPHVQTTSDPQVSASHEELPEDRIENREVVERMVRSLTGHEADVVKLYHLQGKSYREISAALGMPENSIGPTLSRAREKMRLAVDSSA